MHAELATPLGSVPGIGPRRAEALKALGLETVEDFLWRLPFRWEDRSRVLTVRALEADVPATVEVTVKSRRLVRTRRQRFSLVEAELRDATGVVRAVFFNQPYVVDTLVPGRAFRVFGTPARKGLFLELTNPELEPGDGPGPDPVHTGRVVPVYEKLGSLGPRAHRKLVFELLESVGGRIAEVLPADVVRAEGLVGREPAFREAHFPVTAPPPGREAGGEPGPPGSTGERPPALLRLAFEELFVEQLGLAAARLRSAREEGARALRADPPLREALRGMLPFPLTAAQRRVLKEIAADLARTTPMHRLLQGDVGSGKTVVAALAMALAALCGHQAALMAPTELLAEQHARTLEALYARSGIALQLLTGSRARARAGREQAREAIAAGKVGVVVGTHAILEEDVRFRSLALVVIDEQHRFGVVQRARLGAKAGDTRPHVLVMTATPIPRTLALTVYGDLDVSTLDEAPPGRLPPRTVIKTGASEAEAYGFVREQLLKGRQAYVVCPLVLESEAHDLKAAEAWAETVAERYFRGFEVGLVHGRLRARERSRLMEAFAQGEVKVLVGTTVVEVGVDVANATVMVIEHAERFGLSQLHQLRGRIGRGSTGGTCILMIRDRVSELARARLELVRETTDGFRVAEADLELRGPGDFGGTRQWGLPAFLVADLPRDFRLLERARAHAARLASEPGWMESAEAQALLGRFAALRARGHRS